MLKFTKVFSLYNKDEGQTKGKGRIGVKRKGRLPSKRIMNKAGKVQTVYFKPNKDTKSKYIDPTKMSTAELLLGYGNSFKRMLFVDHSKTSRNSQVRNKGDKNIAQGEEGRNPNITMKLDQLADKYGFTLKDFDRQQESFVRKNKNIDNFLNDAQNIYSELYKVNEQHPYDFINKIFNTTKDKLHVGNDRKAKDKQNKIAKRSMAFANMQYKLLANFGRYDKNIMKQLKPKSEEEKKKKRINNIDINKKNNRPKKVKKAELNKESPKNKKKNVKKVLKNNKTKRKTTVVKTVRKKKEILTSNVLDGIDDIY